jgi:hypothetical protein
MERLRIGIGMGFESGDVGRTQRVRVLRSSGNTVH